MSIMMERRARKMDKKRFEAGVMLARMYGVAETLEPFDCLEISRACHLYPAAVLLIYLPVAHIPICPTRGIGGFRIACPK